MHSHVRINFVGLYMFSEQEGIKSLNEIYVSLFLFYP
jgi:hypothetical protein